MRNEHVGAALGLGKVRDYTAVELHTEVGWDGGWQRRADFWTDRKTDRPTDEQKRFYPYTQTHILIGSSDRGGAGVRGRGGTAGCQTTSHHRGWFM